MDYHNNSKQKKFKRKYRIFTNEMDGISLNNWQSTIISKIGNAEDFSQIDELIRSIDGGNTL